MPLEVPEELEVLVDQAADCAQLEARQSAHLKSFMVSGFDVMSHGMTQLLFDALRYNTTN